MTTREIDRTDRNKSNGIIGITDSDPDEKEIVPILQHDMEIHSVVGEEPEVRSSIDVVNSRLFLHGISFTGCDKAIVGRPVFQSTWDRFGRDLTRASMVMGFAAVYLDPHDEECPRVLNWARYDWSLVLGDPTEKHIYRLVKRNTKSS